MPQVQLEAEASQVDPRVVLVVDDEPLVRMIACDCLRDIGCTVYEAACADEALDLIDAHDEVECVFTDIDMPGMNGLDLVREVLRRWPKIACVLTSGRAAPADAHADARFLAKPYDASALTKALRGMVSAA